LNNNMQRCLFFFGLLLMLQRSRSDDVVINSSQAAPNVSDCLGTYNILRNNYAGSLNLFLNTTSGLVEGTIQVDSASLPDGVPGPIEVLTGVSVVITYNASYILFVRSSVGENYYGICMPGGSSEANVNSKTIHGFYRFGTIINSPAYEFDAQQDLSKTPIDKLSDEHFGLFAILNNETAGNLILDRNGVTGTIQMESTPLPSSDSPLPPESIDVVYVWKYNGWYVTFNRKLTNETFYGIYSYGLGSTQLAGCYFSRSTIPWPFDGAKRKAADEPSIPYNRTDSSFQNAFTGRQTFSDVPTNSGNISVSGGPLPSTSIGGNENLRRISWSLHLKNGFYYLFYERPLGSIYWQYYYALYDDTRQAMYGHFNHWSDNGYPWTYHAKHV